MKDSVTIIGSSGFIGKNLKKNLSKEFKFIDMSLRFKKNQTFRLKTKHIIHLAGIAHDLKGKYTDKDYYNSNFELTKQIFNAFLSSDCETFIYLSSVKAVADSYFGKLTERVSPNPITAYGKSKLEAENYLFSRSISKNKRLYIIRPCMIHGPMNKGNLNLLYKFVSSGVPWPLGGFNNQRSYCSIDNLLFIIKELIENKVIPSGIYNMADDEPLSTNKIILLIAKSQGRNQKIWNFPTNLIKFLARLGDKINLSLNSESLKKLTESYVVCNRKIVQAIGKKLPLRSEQGMLKTFESFNK